MTKSIVLQNIPLTPELFILELSFEGKAQAGQFVMIAVPDSAKILPRPISVFNYNPHSQTLSLLIRKRGAGTELLSSINIGDKLTVFGALGKGFPTDLKDKNIILMGGGEGIAPMLMASELLKKENEITIFAGFRNEIESSVLDYFDEDLPCQYTAQDHENQCTRGLITDLLVDIEEPDYIFTCGPIPMMKAIYEKTRSWKTKVYVSMESHMACGVGACMGCTMKGAEDQMLAICTEGPVFLAEEVFHA
ncbi:MAG: dihydroorotate dehydrogenase electron transfer subunit [Brevinema sp.]